MALSEQLMSKALDKFQEMTDDKNCFIFILSSLKNDMSILTRCYRQG